MPAVRATEAPLPVAAAASAQRSMCDARGVGAASPAAREGEERAPGRAPRPGAASRERAPGGTRGPGPGVGQPGSQLRVGAAQRAPAEELSALAATSS